MAARRWIRGVAPVVALGLAAGMWAYVERVLIPAQVAEAVRNDRPRGNLSDLYPRWLGARELLLRGRDPYGPDVTREIQQGVWGRVLDPDRPYDPRDQVAFAYPLYVVFLLAPLVQLPFATVEAIVGWMLPLLTTATVPAWLRLARWRPSPATTAALVALAVGSFPALQGFNLEQPSLVVSALLAAAFLLVGRGRRLAAGAVVALATIKPHLALPAAAWLGIWTLGDWRRRRAFALGFATMLLLLVVGAEYLLPGWVPRFVAAVGDYRRYTGGGLSILDVLTTPACGRPLAAAILAGLAVTWWRLRAADADGEDFALASAVTLAATVVVVPMIAPYNQLLLLPAAFLLLRHRRSLWHGAPPRRMLAAVTVLIVAWPWVTATALGAATLVLPAAAVQRAWSLPLWTSHAIPIAVLSLCTLLVVDRFRTPARAADDPGVAADAGARATAA